MKNFLFLVLCGVVLLAACGEKKNNNNTETSIHARADSTFGALIMDINQRAIDDLEKRITIEVKAKADSIVEQRLYGTTKKTSEAIPLPPSPADTGTIPGNRSFRRAYNDSGRIR